MTRIKFCGLTRPEDAATAAAVGATHAGVILTASSRQVTSDAAREVFAAAPELTRVGVFRRQSVPSIIRDAERSGLDVLQLHGHFTPEELHHFREEFDGSLWAVMPMDAVTPQLPDGWTEIVDSVDAILLDTSAGGKSGGTGVAFDWTAAKPLTDAIAIRTDVMVAGGLTPSNVAGAIRILAPVLVDISSGVESQPGIKDPHLMEAFAEAVRSASIVGAE